MSRHRLLLTASGGALAQLSARDLLWRPREELSSVDSSLGPRLAEVGPVPALHIDFVRLAALVFFCDRTVPRPRPLRRDFEIDVAVSDPNPWTARAERLGALLDLLTGDTWTLTFSRRREPARATAAEPPPGDLAVLFSGGADSACGAVAALTGRHTPVLVSHHDWSSIRGQQRHALDALEHETGKRPVNVSWRLARRSAQVGSGEEFGDERSRRSRSIVFIALGLAVAAIMDSELWIAENGFTSLNPPLSGERRGAMSTRTTHPTFLVGLRETLTEIGLHAALRNPFADTTKGQMFADVRDAIGADAASRLLSVTNSCAKPERTKGFAPDAHCGVCLGCLVRRGAFIAAGLSDATLYKEQALAADGRRARWLSDRRRSTYEATRYRIAVGYSEDDILDLGLPDDTDIDMALALANAGLNELAAVVIP